MPDFYTVVTDTGLQALGLASTQGQSFSLSQAVVGDGNGQSVIPNKGMTTLVNEVWRGDVAGIKVGPEDPNTFIFEFAIPADTGGFTIREVGLLDESGKLFCIGNFPDTEKPVAVNGSVRDLVVRLPLHFENAEVVNLVINAAIVLATKQDIADHNEDPQAHKLATTAQTGFVRLATVEEHKAKAVQSLSCTPFGVWELIKSLMSDACASTSTLKIATSNAVCQVFNRVETHKAADDPHGIVAKVKALLSSSTTSTSTTTFANPKAVKTVQDNLNAHNANAQAHRQATEGQTGFTRLANAGEHVASAGSARKDIAATPYGVWDLFSKVRSDSVSYDNSWRFATSKAVKIVMDALNGHKAANDPHGVVVKVKALLSSSITNSSSTTFAAPKAVKTVNDLLNTHKATSDPHSVVAKVKALLSSSITSTSTTTFATPKAVKTVRDLIVGHTGDAEAHSSGIHGGCIWFDGTVNSAGRPIDVKTGQPDLDYGVCDGRTYTAPDGRRVTTINARDRFLVVAGGKYLVGSKGGADMVSLTVSTTAAHDHVITYEMGNDLSGSTYHNFNSRNTGDPDDGTKYAGGSQAHENRPPYVGLFLIKRL